jgi:WD40 repeat protein
MSSDSSTTAPGNSPRDLRSAAAVPDHTLLHVIGRGSYGEVWEARNVMGTPRAVKIIRREDFDSARPFEREFEGIQRYEPVSRTHAGLVPVLHVGRDVDGACFYYVMELADDAAEGSGSYVPKTLRSELLQRKALPVEECIGIGISLASALGHLHRAGLVHRDVKPSNIIFAGGMAKLADVGLVAQLSDSRSLVGTEGYFAPEGTGQPRSDVFSLGKVLYECVTGQDRLSFPDVPEEWGAGSDSRAAFEFMEIVLRAAEPNPERRYEDTDEMLADLALLKAGKSLRALRRMETRLKRTLQVLAFSALGIAVAAGAWFYEKRNSDRLTEANAKATNAEAETRRLLQDSLVAEARAVRQSGVAGARTQALTTVAKALEAGASLIELRTEAASALGLIDSGGILEDRSVRGQGQSVSWSADAEFCVLGTRKGGRVEIRKRNPADVIATFESGRDILETTLSAGGTFVALVHTDGSVGLWETASGTKLWDSPPISYGNRPWFSQDGTWLVWSADEGLMARACRGGELVNLAPDAGRMRGVYLSPDGTWIACLQVPEKEVRGKFTEKLGFKIFTGLPGRIPVAADVASIRVHEIDSDILLEGVSISADSRYLSATVSEDRMRVWEIPSMSQYVWLRGHQRSVRGTAFHPKDSDILISTSWDGTTRFWSMTTRQEIMRLPVGGEQVLAVPDKGEILIRQWDSEGFASAALSRRSALRMMPLPPHTPLGLHSAVAWHPDGTLLATSGHSGIIVWHLPSGQPVPVVPPGEEVEWLGVAFRRDGNALVYCGKMGVFETPLTRMADGTPAFGEKTKRADLFATGLDWTGPHLTLSGRRSDGKVGAEVHAPGAPPRFLEARVSLDKVATSPDGRRVIVSSYPQGGGTLWDLHQPTAPVLLVPASSRALYAFSADSRVLITGLEKQITFTGVDDPQRPVAPPIPRRDCQFVPSHIAVNAAANLVAVVSSPTEVTLCDGRTFTPILTLSSQFTPFDCSLAFSPDGSQLALAGGAGRLMLWDIAWLREELTRLGLGW